MIQLNLAIRGDAFDRVSFRARTYLYDLVCSLCFRTLASVETQQVAFAFGVPLYICEFLLRL